MIYCVHIKIDLGRTMKLIKAFLIVGIASLTMISCNFSELGYGGEGSQSDLVGLNFSNPDFGGLSNKALDDEQKTPPGMVLIEGGRYTMGRTTIDIMGEPNNKPKTVHVPSFYIDEAEVTNKEYSIYLNWLEKVFPRNNEKYKMIYQSAVPDTTVWRKALGNDGSLPETYLRHRAFGDYPVVGVSWLQAKEYCYWRTNRVAEKELVLRNVLKPLFSNDSVTVEGKNHFDHEVFRENPSLLFGGNRNIWGEQILSQDTFAFYGFEDESYDIDAELAEEDVEVINENPEPEKLYFEDKPIANVFRLPSELEWEYAAKADVEHREFNNIRGRKKYAWNGKYTRNPNSEFGEHYANFKQGKGDYSGIAGWSSDGADFTNKVKSYPPNAFGLYDMAGNVAEWVNDIYRPLIDTEENDFGYQRGNIYTKRQLDENGNAIVADYTMIKYDTLPNGKIIPRPETLPGRLLKEEISNDDTFMRSDYTQANNIDYKDGDIQSSRDYKKDPESRHVSYNSPLIPKPVIDEETGKLVYLYDKKRRTTLISNRSRVYKGGSWRDREFWLDPSQRRFLEDYMSTEYIGFRCAVSRIGSGALGERSIEHQGPKY